MIHLYEMFQVGKSAETKSRLVGWGGTGGGNDY